VTRIEREVWTSKTAAQSDGRLRRLFAIESRLRRRERRRCVLTPADVVRDPPTILRKKMEDLREVAMSKSVAIGIVTI
jgi:hypothetical protein